MNRPRWSTSILVASVLALALAPSISGCASSPTSESTGQYVDDATITTKVKSKLLEDQSLKSFQVHVETYKGNVELSGFVDSQQLATRATQIARGVEGVRSVRNDLVVK